MGIPAPPNPFEGINWLIWWSTRAATFGLVVRRGRVVDSAPYARKWALGCDAREVWRRGRRAGVDLCWTPDQEG